MRLLGSGGQTGKERYRQACGKTHAGVRLTKRDIDRLSEIACFKILLAERRRPSLVSALRRK